MEFRLMYHVYPALACALLISFLEFWHHCRPASTVVLLFCMALFLAKPVMADRFHQETLEDMYQCCGPAGVEIGKRLRQLLPPETVISTTMIGGLSYNSKLETIDQLGLTDSYTSHVPMHHFRRGHARGAPFSYLASRKVNLVIGHPIMCACDQLCYEDLPNVFIKFPENRCLRSYYLTQSQELTTFFCEHPEWFVLSKVSCDT